MHRYPDGNSTELRAALGRHHGLDPARIVCGAGSDELISLLIRAYAGPGDEVLYGRHGFLMYPIGALAAGATPVAAPENDLTFDVDAVLARVTPSDQARLHRQSEQSDRHLCHARRDAAAACRAAADRCCW